MNSNPYLLDSNVLIALATPDHTGHAYATAWMKRHSRDFATCPITQGALIRFYMQFGRDATIAKAKSLLSRITHLPRHTFWPDSISCLEIPGKGVVGYRQVTDAYLIALARTNGGLLATMDEALVAVHGDTCELVL